MVQPHKHITKSPQETARLGEELAISLRTLPAQAGQNSELHDQNRKRGQNRRATIVCLYGELGSGKTTFAQGFAKGLGIQSRLLSPTFIIVRRYDLKNSSGFLFHIDLYRLQKTEEIEALGISEFFNDSNSFMLIEWAEKLNDLLPQSRVDIRFSVVGDSTHVIMVEEYDTSTHT